MVSARAQMTLGWWPPDCQDLCAHLKSVQISLSAYDIAFQQTVTLYVTYHKEEIVRANPSAPP